MITNIKYPLFVSPGYDPKYRKLYVPTDNHKYLKSGILAIEYYEIGDRCLIFDALPYADLVAKNLQTKYEDRLQWVRQIVVEQVGDFSKVIDLPMDIAHNPAEALRLAKNYLTQGFFSVRMAYVYGEYVFGESRNGEYFEYKKKI